MRKAFKNIMAAAAICSVLIGCRINLLTRAAESSAYRQMTMDEAQEVLESSETHLLVDVRTPEEFAEGHIPGAINVPNETIAGSMIAELPDQDQEIYVYCRSGRRSKEAAEKLSAIGYTHIIEIGGIQDWKGEIIPEALMVYRYGSGYGEHARQSEVCISILPDFTVQLSALDGEVTVTPDLSTESVEALMTFTEGKVSDLAEDMTDACIADGEYAYLSVNGKTYGGRAVQNASFDLIGKQFKETVGQAQLDAFSTLIQDTLTASSESLTD